MKYGYAKTYGLGDKVEMNINRQIEKLSEIGCDEIMIEECNKDSVEFPLLDALFDRMGKGDTLVVTSLSRLGHDLVKNERYIKKMCEKGIGFESITFGGRFEMNPMTKCMLLVMYTMVEYEWDTKIGKKNEILAF